jgi:hypothetical protein
MNNLLGIILTLMTSLAVSSYAMDYNQARAEHAKIKQDRKAYYNSLEDKFAKDYKIPDFRRKNKSYEEHIDGLITAKNALAIMSIYYYENNFKDARSRENYLRKIEENKSMTKALIELIIKKFGTRSDL